MTKEKFKIKDSNSYYVGYDIIDDDNNKYYGGRLAQAEKLCDLLNDLYEENEELKKVLGVILLEVKRDISNTNQAGEIRVFINPNSFNLISEVLRKYGALKEWYE